MAEAGSGMTASRASPAVFMSYASPDAAVAEAVVAALEQAGLPCWIAPRNVVPGSLYADEIVGAINDARVVVLILSGHAVASAHVCKEIERASSKRRRIIALHTDSAPLTRSFEYFLSESQWIEQAPGGAAAATAMLVAAVQRYLDPSITVGPSPEVGRPDRSAPVVHPDPSAAPGAAAARRRRWLLVAAITVIGSLLGWLLGNRPWLSRPAPVAESRPAAVINDYSIAVLPFTDMSEQKDQEYFADGMAEEVLDMLAKIPTLKVIGRTSSFQFKGRNDDLRAVGAKLGAANVVEGSVRKAGSRIRVTAQLIDAVSGAHRWSESYDRDFGDVLALQQEIATSIARALQITVGADDVRPLRRLPSEQAYTLYLQGRVLQDRQQGIPLSQALDNFEQALALDPTFLGAAEAVAITCIDQALDGAILPRVAWQRARQAAERALRIDAKSAPAHAVLGLVHALGDYEWNAADAEIGQALAQNPRDPVTLNYAARVAHAQGRGDEALRRIGASLALDPLNPYAQQTLGEMLYTTGDLGGAELAFRKSIAISPTGDGSHYALGRILLARGDLQGALKEMQAEVAAGSTESGLALVYHALGRKKESDAVLARVRRPEAGEWPYGVAAILAYRGELDQAFEWLEKDYEQRDPDLPMFVQGDPELVQLRRDPRYMALLRRLNLAGTSHRDPA
jgi:TolB-like protein/Flp pilus assembly protein TadD